MLYFYFFYIFVSPKIKVCMNKNQSKILCTFSSSFRALQKYKKISNLFPFSSKANLMPLKYLRDSRTFCMWRAHKATNKNVNKRKEEHQIQSLMDVRGWRIKKYKEENKLRIFNFPVKLPNHIKIISLCFDN